MACCTQMLYAVLACAVIVASGPSEARSKNEDTCDGRLQMEVLSLTRDGPGTIVGVVQYENTSNFAMRLGVHSGGARGKDTYLISDGGEKWPKVANFRGGGGTTRQVFLPGVKTKSTMKFSIRSGGEDAKQFVLINWVQLLAEEGITGPDRGGWCRFEVRDLPLSS